MRSSALLLAVLPLSLAAPAKRAPLIVPRDADLIEGKYIVKTKSGSSNVKSMVQSLVQTIAADADMVYNHFGGFAASLTKDEVESLRGNPDVEYIEQDAMMHTMATQSNAPWGLARLSNKEPGSTTYTYDDSAGQGTCAFIIDTGVDASHPEFQGRATFLENFVSNVQTDDNGHGTHVAGTIGSKTYGVAKKTSIYAVKVLDGTGSGSNSAVLGGMNYVAESADEQDCPNGIVVNMSLGGSFSQAINDAAAGIVDAGHFLAVAAGNGDTFGNPQDASDSSPASEPSVCTVGASDRNDRVASFSNYGSLLDIYAPGVGILSTFPDGQTNTLDGTSMATPHIAGLGAYFLGLGAANPGNLCDFIASQALEGALSGVPSGTVNLLAQNGEA